MAFSDLRHLAYYSLGPPVLSPGARSHAFYGRATLLCVRPFTQPPRTGPEALPWPGCRQAAAVNTVRVSFHADVLVSFRCIPRSRVARPCCGLIFNFPRDLHPVLHSFCTDSQSFQQREGSLSPSPREHLLLFDCSRSDGEVVSHCGSIFISLLIRDLEHRFVCLLAVCISSSEKCLSHACVLTGLFVFLAVVCEFFIPFGC